MTVRTSKVPRLVPLEVLTTSSIGDNDKIAIARDAAVQVGNAYEVDLVVAEHVAPGSASVLHQWFVACRGHWNHYSTKSREVRTLQQVTNVQQQDSKEGRTDLHDVLDALESNPELSGLASILDKEPPWCELERTGSLSRDGNTSTWTVALPAKDYPDQLGGAMRLGETTRWLTIYVNHAAWRDRRVRRLTALQVTVEQTWPATARLPQLANPA